MYDHYNISLQREEKKHKKKLIFVFKCKYGNPEHTDVSRDRLSTSNGTSNLIRYLDRCAVDRGSAPTQPTLHQTLSTYTPYKHRAVLVMQAATAPRPFTAPAQKWRRAETDMLRPQTPIPDRTTTSTDTTRIYRSVKERVKKYFSVSVCSRAFISH